MLGLQIAITLHLVGIIFWIGGLGARLVLLISVKSGASEEARSQFHQLQKGIHLMMETPGSVITLLAGGFLIHATKITVHQSWFGAKMALVLGVIVVELLASRQIKAFKMSGRVGQQAVALFASLVVFTLLALVAVTTKF